MSEGEETPVYHSEHSNAGKWILIVVAALYVAGSSYFLFDQHSKQEKLTEALAADRNGGARGDTGRS